MPGYHQVLIRWNYANVTAAVIVTDRVGVGLISFAFEVDAEVLQAIARLPSHRSGSFANAAREN